MKAAFFAFTRQGLETALRVMELFPDAEIRAYAPERICGGRFSALHPSGEILGDCFRWADAMIFIGSCGIAVREIAPFVRDKRTDPAVLCIDELGKFVIPLLSGHIGGANELAVKTAGLLGAVPVVTTATDINHRFSVDAWAAKNGFLIDDMHLAKEISAAILERDLPLACQLPVHSDYPGGTFPGASGPLGIFIGWEKLEPFEKTLRLIPRNLHLGIGCRKGTESSIIRDGVKGVTDEVQIDLRALKCAASIDLKADEPGLLEYCREENLPISFYSAVALAAVPGTFSHSDFVEKVTGIDCVCERAAMVGADRLILAKTVRNGITIAIGAEMKGVSFG